MNNEKRVVLLSLTILALLLTGFTWAYWNSSKVLGASKVFNEETVGNTITIGSAPEGKEIKTKVSVPLSSYLNDKKLVPEGFENGEDSVSKIELKFDLKWDELEATNNIAKGTLASYDVEFEGYKINVEEAYAPKIDTLFDIKVIVPEDHSVALGTERKEAFSIIVSFSREPEDQYEYREIIGKELQLDFTVNVTPAQ